MNLPGLQYSYGKYEDDIDPYQEAVSEHERRSTHNPVQDRSYCEMCVVLFNFMVEDGKLCGQHPESYFEKATKEKGAYCEQCLTEKSL